MCVCVHVFVCVHVCVAENKASWVIVSLAPVATVMQQLGVSPWRESWFPHGAWVERLQCATLIAAKLNYDHNLLNESVYLTHEIRQNETLNGCCGEIGPVQQQQMAGEYVGKIKKNLNNNGQVGGHKTIKNFNTNIWINNNVWIDLWQEKNYTKQKQCLMFVERNISIH